MSLVDIGKESEGREPIAAPTVYKRPKTRHEHARDRRREESRRQRDRKLDQKLVRQLVIQRMQAPDGRFARALRRILSRNIAARLTRLGLK